MADMLEQELPTPPAPLRTRSITRTRTLNINTRNPHFCYGPTGCGPSQPPEPCAKIRPAKLGTSFALMQIYFLEMLSYALHLCRVIYRRI